MPEKPSNKENFQPHLPAPAATMPPNHTRLIKKQGKLPAQAFRKQLRGYFLTLELKTMLK
jgi:hypothetical protein